MAVYGDLQVRMAPSLPAKRLQNSSGRGPVSSVPATKNELREESSPNSVGIVPEMLVDSMFSNRRVDSSPNSVGRVPVISESYKSNSLMLYNPASGRG